MGTHRSGARSRGVSKGPVIAVVAVLLLAGAVFAWFQLSDRAAQENTAAASECVEGDATLFVTVDPDIEAPVRAVADKYNASKPQVRDHCAKVVVTARPSADMVAGLTAGGAWNGVLGPQPALWIPSSSRSVEAARVPGLIEGDPTPIAASPIVLAVPEELRQALDKAQTTWADLPRLQQGSLSAIGVPNWAGLKLALPAGDATLAVATAVAAATSGTDPLTEQAAQTGQVVSAVSGIAAGAPDADTTTALTTIAAPQPAKAAIHAVPATEQQVQAHGGAAIFRPIGSAPVADHPAAMMSGQWVDQTQNLIASVFAEYLRAPEQAQFFTTAGFTTAPPATGPGASRAALEKVRATLDNPVLGVQSTVLLDTSSSMSTIDGSATRLATVIGALKSTMNVMPPDFGLGVWAFAKNLDGTTPYDVLTPTKALTDDHRTAVLTELDDVEAAESRTDQAYPTLLAAYRNAVTNYVAGKSNSILLVTDGPDDDSTITGQKLLADLTAAIDKSKPVRINIIVIGGAGTQTLQALAQQTGGTYTKLATSNDLSFGTAMVQALTTP
ncbi:VWA domain-containing protein [Nocardia sp. XZ_19_385]|uniref:VWA domain-containing protein n=1 Tax=Nocardia sp. XZ_19_385 TaxID=2769488 RepID=UPI00188E1BB5|nr:VWA domain-containing protein [Nocardia sp. XZ_19_385]